MKRTLLTLLLSTATLGAGAQKNAVYISYIETYKQMAIDQMNRYRIPASITLAQGILESAAGRSYLATTANNHFGIKVGSSWTGPWVTKTDDATNDKFRKYANVAESFEDHSLFLQKQRYAALFDLELTDYQGWAYGLKAAGYATNPHYPTLLTTLIEEYNLTQYDLTSPEDQMQVNPQATSGDREHDVDYNYGQYGMVHHAPKLCNNVAYVVAREGDTFEGIAYEYKLKPNKLRKYNEVSDYHNLHAGELVYLKAKKKHVAKRLRGAFHKIENGESMHSISQRYGIKLGQLYKWNMLPADFQANVGDLLILK